jgi:hypothetical protein
MPDLATYNLRDSEGYLIHATHDLEEAIQEYDRRKGEKVHFDDFGITELRDRLKEKHRLEREAKKAADDG